MLRRHHIDQKETQVRQRAAISRAVIEMLEGRRLMHADHEPTSAYFGVPFPVGTTPVTIQAEDYDLGGQGFAYNDTTAANTVGAYRNGVNEGVDLKPIPNTTEQYRISDAYVGEWVEYSIDVQQSGDYTLELRLSNADPNAKLHVEVDGIDVTGAITVPDTNNFNTFKVVSKTVALEAGTRVLRLSFDVGAGPTRSVAGVDWLRLTHIVPPPPPPPPPPPADAQAPYFGTPSIVGSTPATIQAEHYDTGGQGVAYNDTSVANTAGAYRTGAGEGVDLKAIPNVSGQYRISDAYVGEWVEYSIDVQESGDYALELRLSNADPNAKLHVEVDGIDVTGAVTVPDTNNFNTFATVSVQVTLPAGAHVLRLSFDVGAGPTGSVAGVDWLRFTQVETPEPPPPPPPPPQGIVVSHGSLTVNENGQSAFTVNLAEAPASDVTVTISRGTDDDGDLSVDQATLTFTAENWNVPQTVNVAADDDADFTDGQATFTIGSDGLASKTLTATEDDDDIPPPPPGPVQVPYLGNPFAVGATPITIQAEHYDTGGQGVAYNDTTGSNTAGAYRTGADEGVDLKTLPNTSGQYRVSDAYVGEWVEYSIDVQESGDYTLDLRVSNADPGAKVHVEIDGVDITGAIAIPDTNHFNTFQTIGTTVSLTSGQRVLRLSFDIGAGPTGSVAGIDWLRLTKGEATPTPIGGTATWQTVAPAPTIHVESNSAVVGGKLYLLGRMDSQADVSPRSDVYDPATNVWTRIADMPEPTTHAGTAVVGTTIYVAGGFVGDDPGPTTSHVWKYDTVSNTWSAGPDLPESRGAGVLLLVGTVLHFMGGVEADRVTDSSSHWRLDLDNPASGWVEAPAMPNARNHLAGEVLDGKLYVIGGQHAHNEQTGNQDDVDVYDPASETWSQAADLPTPRGHIAASTFVRNGRIVVVGGMTNGRVSLKDVIEYDPASNTWVALTSLPAARKSPIAGLIGDEMFVSGGQLLGSSPSSATWKLHLPGRWEVGASMPSPQGEVAGGIIGNKLYLIGEGSSTSTFVYNLSTGAWSTAKVRPNVGNHHAVEVIDGKLYVFGGLAGGDGKVQIYDPAADDWTFGADIPFGTGSTNTAVIDGQVYLAGGIVDFVPGVGGTSTTSAARYDPVANTWTMLPSMPQAVNHAAAATDGNKLYLFGGRTGGGGVANGVDTVQVYDPATQSWSSSLTGAYAPLPQARGGMGKAVFYPTGSGGEFYVIGGETKTGSGATSNKVYNRVDIYNPSTNTWRLGSPMPTARHGVFPVLHAGRIFVAGGGTVAGASTSNKLEIYNPTS